MKKFLIIAWLIIITQVQAQVSVGEMEAFSTARCFLEQHDKQQPFTLSLSKVICSKRSGQPTLFVFKVEPKGYIIVSALDKVLAYSFESSFPASEKFPDPFIYWLDLYNRQTDYLIEHPEQFKNSTESRQTVEPLLTSIWGQGCFHNEACPEDELGPCQHVSAGCVAIAMAQIMYYHKQPLKGSGTMTYSCFPYGILSADFGQTTYLWEAMADTLHESNSAVAKLISHCGISVKMLYGAHQSSASSANALTAFRQFFSYPSATLSHRTNYSDEEWTAMIRKNINERHPVYFEGTSSIGTHAFVCDGYDGGGMFHFNFGWDGVADGFYSLDSPYGFSDDQSIIHNIIPFNTIPIQADEHGIIYVAPDGNGDGSSWENATKELQLAIFKSQADNSIWVKEGIYMGNLEESYAFNLQQSCKLYGGFKGDEPYNYDLSLRNFETHSSILDGNQRQGVINVLANSKNDSILIDGFTIQNGKASLSGGILIKCNAHVKNCKICHNSSQTKGGGLSKYSINNGNIFIEDCEFFSNEAHMGGAINDCGNATYRRCKIHDNNASVSGGGILCSGEQSLFTDCTISNNTAREEGGGMVCKMNSNTTFSNCLISNNTAQTEGGGIVSKTDSRTTFWSCLINNNTAQIGGGCHLIGYTSLYNCTIVKNEGTDDYGGAYYAGKSKMKNCIIWGNTSHGNNAQIGPSKNYSYCAVEDNLSESETNFDAKAENDGESPGFYVRFNNPNVIAGNSGQGGDWRLQSGSLCIDRVNTIDGQPATDLEGNPRLKHRNVDLGAYESDFVAFVIDDYICDDEPYYYDTIPFIESGTYTILYHDQPYDSLIILQLIKLPSSILQSHETICEGEAYDFNGTLLQETGHYSTIIACKSYELDLTVIPIPHLRCSNDTIVEYGHPVLLTASGAESYLWSTGDTTKSIMVFPKENMMYTVTGFSQNGCSTTASITVQVNESKETILFPNPTSNKVEIYMPLIDEVEIFNLFGDRIAHAQASHEAVELDLSICANGIYIVRVRQSNNYYYKKLVIKH